MNAISLTMRRLAALTNVTMPATLYGTPSLAGVTANVVAGEATMRSHANATSQAPPHTVPSIIAITGAANSSISRMSCGSGSSQPSGSRPSVGSSSTSCPADQTGAPGCARRMTTRALLLAKRRERVR